jgi:RimJ/RimL family protein N-acetyltransferase
MERAMHVSPTTLTGRFVRLEPLRAEHSAGLLAAICEPILWKWLPRGPLTSLEDALGFIAAAQESGPEGVQFPFVLLDAASGAVAGTTRYLDIREAQRGLEIGWTVVGTAWQRTRLNTEAKMLLMRHAFETLGALRVQFKTDERNVQSRRALERLGTTFEGVLRAHRIRPDGTLRSSAYYSVLHTEWPDVRRRLESLLQQRHAADGAR